MTISKQPLDKQKLTEHLKEHAEYAAKTANQLEFYTLDEQGELQQIDSKIIFVRTSNNAGFSVLPSWEDESSTLYSYPHATDEEDLFSSFSTKHKCANVFDLFIDVREPNNSGTPEKTSDSNKDDNSV